MNLYFEKLFLNYNVKKNTFEYLTFYSAVILYMYTFSVIRSCIFSRKVLKNCSCGIFVYLTIIIVLNKIKSDGYTLVVLLFTNYYVYLHF